MMMIIVYAVLDGTNGTAFMERRKFDYSISFTSED